MTAKRVKDTCFGTLDYSHVKNETLPYECWINRCISASRCRNVSKYQFPEGVTRKRLSSRLHNIQDYIVDKSADGRRYCPTCGSSFGTEQDLISHVRGMTREGR